MISKIMEKHFAEKIIFIPISGSIIRKNKLFGYFCGKGIVWS